VGLILTVSLDKPKNQGRDYHNLPYIPLLAKEGKKFAPGLARGGTIAQAPGFA